MQNLATLNPTYVKSSGVLAQRVPDTKLVWNAERMEVKGRPELKKFIQRPYRKGWQIEV